jgi:hypothetical protein
VASGAGWCQNRKVLITLGEGYEYARGEFVTFTAEELKALDVESSKVIDLEKFVPHRDASATPDHMSSGKRALRTSTT